MKRRILALLLIVVLLLSATLFVCCNDVIQLKFAMHRYQRTLNGDLPDDLTLTIYYLPHYILTRAPLTVERLMNMDPTVKIVIPSEVLVKHLSTLQRLDASAVQPAEKFGINARLYYVFETGDQKLLEVVMQQFIGDDDAFGTFVNGIQVKKNTIFYEIILPFLTEEDRSNLGLSARSNDTDAKEFFFG